ncbi:hypothetical protein KDL01_15825 [Actinospica durhamensis]|uniref:NACHT N-terminal Helical domain-containing protein n=1 Tax=Actinospica durhamensis TaxID=1508375 RepID=A0A941ETD9_9ACTN|nr:hypothetical protein [Actinospica durhamensis]MBR7834744.1 hypothetical protein [Actinospica durhamensis]
MPRDLTFADAVKILGSDSEKLHTLDLLFSGAINLATATHRPTDVIKVLRSAKLIADHSLDLMRRVNTVVKRTKPQSRHEVLVAAHTIVAVVAFFEVLGEFEPLMSAFDLTLEDKLLLKSGYEPIDPIAAKKASLPVLLAAASIPPISPVASFASVTADLREFYIGLVEEVIQFVSGLSRWDALNETQRDRITSLHTGRMVGHLLPKAVERYSQRLTELAALRPEFFVWTTMMELQAAAVERADDRRALARVGELLETFAGQATAAGPIGERLALAYAAELARPLVDTDEAQTVPNLLVPSVQQIYIDPAFRVANHGELTRPAEDRWWSETVALRENLSDFLAWHLSTGRALESPTLVLGHPGAGKSLFTKVLAARAPSGTFAPLRVELRHVAANAGVLDQIEQAMRASLNETVKWADFARESAEVGRIPLVIFDGLDELLQTWGSSRSNFLAEVADFQQREAVQKRDIVVIVTSRTLVTTQAAIPGGCTMLRIEPFAEAEIAAWVAAWNTAVSGANGDASPLDIVNVLRYPSLAEQPLLLLLLAIYNAGSDHAWTSTAGAPLEIHGLYEGLLRQFAYREVHRRTHPAVLDNATLKQMIETELDTLSIVAFSMFNRGAQSVLLTALDDDLKALRPETRQSPDAWTEGQRVVGRFFFIHEARAGAQDGTVLRSYEFLHATFGEYLVARRILQELRLVVALRRAVSVPLGDCDGTLFTLLSFAPLTSRGQVVDFLTQMLLDLPEADQQDATSLVISLFRVALEPRVGDRYAAYRPAQRDAPSRHAVYKLNLLMMVLAVRTSIPFTELFGFEDEDADAALDLWSGTAHLWRACLAISAWRGVVNFIRVAEGSVGFTVSTSGMYFHHEREQSLLASSGADVAHVRLIGAAHRYANFFEYPGIAEAIIALRLGSLAPYESRDALLESVLDGEAGGGPNSPHIFIALLEVIAADSFQISRENLVRLFVRGFELWEELGETSQLLVFDLATALLADADTPSSLKTVIPDSFGLIMSRARSPLGKPEYFRMLEAASSAGLNLDPSEAEIADALANAEQFADAQSIHSVLSVALEYRQWEWLATSGLRMLVEGPRRLRTSMTSQAMDLIQRGLVEYAASAADGPEALVRLEVAMKAWRDDRIDVSVRWSPGPDEPDPGDHRSGDPQPGGPAPGDPHPSGPQPSDPQPEG